LKKSISILGKVKFSALFINMEHHQRKTIFTKDFFPHHHGIIPLLNNFVSYTSNCSCSYVWCLNIINISCGNIEVQGLFDTWDCLQSFDLQRLSLFLIKLKSYIGCLMHFITGHQNQSLYIEKENILFLTIYFNINNNIWHWFYKNPSLIFKIVDTWTKLKYLL